MKRFGVVDTTFSRVDMGAIAVETLRQRAKDADIRRVVVPGVKDLPAAARRFYDEGCDLVIACGMVGAEDVDKVCGHEASLGLMWLRTHFGRPLLEVFIHMDEPREWMKLRGSSDRGTAANRVGMPQFRDMDEPFERDVLGKVVKRPATKDEIARYEAELKKLSVERTREHAINAYWLLYEPHKLLELAGTGQRQGYDDAGPVA